MLENICWYLGNDAILIGDGSLHEITHIGDTFIGTSNYLIKLKNVLLVSNLAKNLLSISQLTSDYPYNCEFCSIGFFIKEWVTNYILLTSQQEGNLYVLSLPMKHLLYKVPIDF